MSRKNLALQLWPKMLSTNRVREFFGHQYLWEESIGILGFLHEDNHLGNVKYERISRLANGFSQKRLKGFFMKCTKLKGLVDQKLTNSSFSENSHFW